MPAGSTCPPATPARRARPPRTGAGKSATPRAVPGPARGSGRRPRGWCGAPPWGSATRRPPGRLRAREDEVAARATPLGDRVLRQRRDLSFASRLTQPPADWFTFGLLRGFGLPDRPLLLFTPELWTRDLLAFYRARGLNIVHAVALVPPSLRARDWTGVKRLVFGESDGFWLAPPEPPGPVP